MKAIEGIRKAIRRSVIAFIAMMFVFQGCDMFEEDHKLSVNTGSVSFTAAGESKTFKITSDTDWKISGQPSWVTVTPPSGKGDATVTVAADANPLLEDRSGELTVTVKKADPATVKFTQKARAPVITVTSHPAPALSFAPGSVSGSLSVAASIEGSAEMKYQWFLNTAGNNSGGSAVTGATSGSYDIPFYLPAGSYYYFCEVRATGYASVRSEVSAVTVAIPPPATALQVSISGDIDHEVYEAGKTCSATFNRFPVSVDEWKQVREQIGEEPHGAVVLQVMATELYRRDRTAGADCMKETVTVSQYSARIRRLDEIYNTAGSNARPYQMAAFLTGASWDNGYNPTKPYTIEMRVATAKSYGYSNDFQATVIYLEIKSNGHTVNDGWQPFAVLKTHKSGEPGENGTFYIVSEGSSIYDNCREKSFTVPFNGLD